MFSDRLDERQARCNWVVRQRLVKRLVCGFCLLCTDVRVAGAIRAMQLKKPKYATVRVTFVSAQRTAAAAANGNEQIRAYS